MSTARHKIIKVGIMPIDQFKKRSIAIANGQYKPKRNEPRIWFRSMKSLAHVLSEENQALLRVIVETKPQSIKELEDITGRKANNLLRTLRSMENYGFVKLKEGKGSRGRSPLIPEVIYDSAEIDINFFGSTV